MFYRIHRLVAKPLFQSLRQLVLLRLSQNLTSKMAFQYPQAYRDDAVVSKGG